MPNNMLTLSGNGTANNGTATIILVPAQGVGTVIRVLEANVNVLVSGTGGTPSWSIQDSLGNVVHQGAGTVAGGTTNCEYGGAGVGFPVGTNTSLNLVVSGGTTQATAFASVVVAVAK